jgi:hypothetical protein
MHCCLWSQTLPASIPANKMRALVHEIIARVVLTPDRITMESAPPASASRSASMSRRRTRRSKRPCCRSRPHCVGRGTGHCLPTAGAPRRSTP